ncbi:MAG: M20/M25/M40 family metallo-hydrolase [Kiritimatiellaeota bacterium]|nr:M20/M25/M40 family metallo-hydrolase [Kiritimatiellota bacterium]
MHDAALSLLKNLVATPTPSGWEHDGLKLLADYVAPAAAAAGFDIHGNLRAVMNPGAPLRVMLEGHCDEIGFMVQYADDKGFLTLCAVGGVTAPLLAGERVVIQGRKGPVNGVFGARPPHLMKPEDRNKTAPQSMEDATVDIGASSKAEALELVELGAPAVIDAGWRPLAGGRVACRGFDNRIGAFAVAEAFKRLRGEKLNVELHLVASVQEELGLVGARTAAYDIAPHAGICVDVGFASDTPGNEVKLVGEAKLGGGPLMVCGPTYNPVLRSHLEKQAGDAGIVLQRQVRARGDGTNAMAMRLARGGAAVALVSIPLRYMHSAVETLSLDDVEKTIEVTRLAVLNMPADLSFKR